MRPTALILFALLALLSPVQTAAAESDRTALDAGARRTGFNPRASHGSGGPRGRSPVVRLQAGPHQWQSGPLRHRSY